MRIIKLGGSLLDWPACAEAFTSWVHDQPSMPNVVIVGGGAPVSALRERSLSVEMAHWEAIRCMEANARRFASEQLLPIVPDIQSLDGSANSAIFVLGNIENLVRQSNLPHGWSVTSDSIAAWIAARHSASELVLLKSCDANGRNAAALAEAGMVDEYFSRIAYGLIVRFVNLRAGHEANGIC